MYEDRIAIDPAVRHEKPIIKGTRVPLEIILGSLGAAWRSTRSSGNMTCKRKMFLLLWHMQLG